MKTKFGATFLLLGIALAASVPLQAKDKESPGRLVTGRVMDKQDNPVADAVVYLTNTRTRAVKTYIVGPDGAYRFPALSPDIDYEIYAQSGGHKSDTKSVSQFDSRMQVTINLRISR
jgi:hypothetical protein